MENQNLDLSKKERKQLRREERLRDKESKAKRRNINRLLLWFSVLAVIAVVVFGIVRFVSQAPEDGESANSSVGDVAPGEWIKGNSSASTTLIEYSDFQCPACGNYYPIVKRLVAELGDDMRFVYRHFPLKQIHPNAELAARASEAAGMQGKFWEMHDIIFENQGKWSSDRSVDEIFADYARDLELDVDKFGEDLNSKEVKDAVNKDLDGATRAGFNSTPTFILDGKKISPPRTYEDFRKLILQTI